MADAVQLAALRVSAEIDALGVSKGATEIESAAGRAGAAMKALENALSAADRAAQSNSGIEKLKRQFIDGYGTSQNLERALNSISRALDRGKISAEAAAQAADGAVRKYGVMGNAAQFAAKGQLEYAAAIDRANASLSRQSTMRPANQNQLNGGQSFAAQNLMYQFQDIGVTAAMGMNPLMIALQQGSQISATLGPMGAAGAVRSLGAAFAALISPVSLVTVGLVAGTAAAIQYFSSASDGASKTKTLLDQQNEAIRTAAQAWGAAAPALHAVVAQMDRAKNIDLGREAFEALAAREQDGLSEKLDSLNEKFVMAGRSMRQMQVDPAFIRDFGETFSDLRSKLEQGTATVYDLGRAQRMLTEGMANTGTKELRAFATEFDKITAAISRSAEEARKRREEMIKTLAGGSDVQSIIENNRITVGPNTYSTGTFIPKNVPTPTERPNIELEGGTDAGAKADIVGQVQARQSLIQTQREEAEHLALEIRLIGASTRERAVATARLEAEIELRRQGIGVLTDEGRAYIAKAQAMAAARVETERLNQLAISRDPAGARSNFAAQVQARETLFQSQRDEMAMLAVEAQLIGASSKERAVMVAGMQAEQTLRRQGISALSEEGKAYIANAEAMAAARVEIERRNQLALSRDPAGSRADIAGQVQARQQLFQTQSNEMESLRLEAQLVGANAQTRARMTAALQAEQQLRAQGISSLSKEGQAYVANAQAIASARLEIERSQAAYQSWQNAGSSAIDALTASTGSLQDRLKGFADAMLSWITQLALANPLKNALFGTNLPTLADLGKPQVPGLSATNTATMTVTAGSVIVNGGQFPAIPGTSLPGTTTGTLSSALGITNGVRPTLTPTGVVNSPVPVSALQNPALAGLLKDPSLAARSTVATPTGSIEDYIRQSAIQRGIDPNVAVRVAQSEGGLQSWNLQSQYFKNGIQEPSFGPFQLLKGGQGTGYPTGLGNDFMNQTGLDPALAANGPQGIDFALDHASKNGWGAWYGADKAGISKWQGIGTNPGVDPSTTNSISSSMTKLTQSTSSAVKGINTLGDSSTQVGSTLADSLGKLSAPAAIPAAPAVAAPTAPASGGGLLSGLFGGIFKLFGFADGTDFAPGGVALVGERGPELVNLPRGSQVKPNHKLVMNSEERMRMPANVKHEFYINVGGNGDKELMGRMQVAADEAAARSVRFYNDVILPGRMQEVSQNPEFVG